MNIKFINQPGVKNTDKKRSAEGEVSWGKYFLF
jgi:hypothetical protein